MKWCLCVSLVFSNLHIPGSVVNVSIAWRSPAKHDGLEIKRFPLGVGDRHVDNPLYLVSLLLLTVGPQHLHNHVERPSPGQSHVLQQRQVFLLSELVTHSFTFSEDKPSWHLTGWKGISVNTLESLLQEKVPGSAFVFSGTRQLNDLLAPPGLILSLLSQI